MDATPIKTYNPEIGDETEEWDLSSHWWEKDNQDGMFIEILNPEEVNTDHVYSADVIWILNDAP